jgi:hypothetical protein
MKTFVDNFSNQSSGNMDAFVRTANAKNLIPFVAPVPGQVFTNVGTAHDWFNHSHKEYARGDIHNNTAESFSAILERAKQGVFHYLSKKHLSRL